MKKIIASAIGVSFALLVAGCNSEKSAAEKMLRDYFKAYYSERPTRAYDYLSAEDQAALPISDYMMHWGPYAPCYEPGYKMDPVLAKSIGKNPRLQRMTEKNDGIFNAWLGEYFSQKIMGLEITGQKATAKIELTVPQPPTSAIAYINGFLGDEKKPVAEIVSQLKSDYKEVRSTTVVAECRMVMEEGHWMVYKGFAEKKAGK